MSAEVESSRVRVNQVTKKYCRSLRRSLWYGARDLWHEVSLARRSDRLRLRPGEFLALDNLSLEIGPGECLGLLGANGAGKSTLLKILNGLIRPDSGAVQIVGRLGALIELGAGFSPVLTGRENIYVNGAVLGLSKREIDLRLERIIEFSELGEFIHSPVKFYSTGMQARLGFAVAAHLDLDILLVDEVLAVGDTAFRMKCFEHILNLKASGKTIVLVSHNLVDILRVCDRAVVLVQGRKAFDGDVTSGIAAYEEHLLSSASTARETRPAAPAWIEEVSVVSPAAGADDRFVTGDDVQLDIVIGAREAVRRARLVVHVSSPSVGTLGSFSSPHAGLFFDVLPPGRRVRLTLEEVPLLVGSYGVTLSLYGEGIRDFMDAKVSAAQIRIVGPPVDTLGYGVCHSVLFKHRWDAVENNRRVDLDVRA